MSDFSESKNLEFEFWSMEKFLEQGYLKEVNLWNDQISST